MVRSFVKIFREIIKIRIGEKILQKGEAPRLFLTIFLKVQFGGEGGIRTLEAVRPSGFRDRPIQPTLAPLHIFVLGSALIF